MDGSEDEIVNQVETKNSEIKKIDISLNKVCKSICKITYNKISADYYGTGFFIRLYIDEKELFCLMTNEHVITRDMIESKEIIELYYNYEEKYIKIKLDNEKRFIKYDKKMDIVIIEIIPDDKIKEKYFLLPNSNNINDRDYINQDIYIVQFPEGKNLSYSEGNVKDINNYELVYDASTKNGSSGSPIFLKNTTKVIGIHKKGHTKIIRNYGTLISSIIQSLQPKKENNFTEFYKNGEYYIGQSLDGKRHGKGIIFNKNDNIIYEGDFVNGKIEGNGKILMEDGNYYSGQFLNDKKHGKGTIKNKDGKTIYEGDFLDNIIEGNGKLVYENGEYYIGEFLHGKMNGKGKFYDKNGIILYEGDFLNNKMEGYGKISFENLGYYIGQMLNNRNHGKGTIFDKNGNIKYKGDFVDNKKEGKGKLFLSDGYYINGEWLDGQLNGKGKIFDKNGKIVFELDFVNGEMEDYGKIYYENGDYYIGQMRNFDKHGKGTEYYKNGNIKYEGDFVENKREGEGKFFDEKGNVYIGQFLKGKKKGEGISFDKNGIIIKQDIFRE